MSKDLNRHMCIGRLGKDPEVRSLASGETVTTITVACGESWKDRNTGQKKTNTEWIRYVAFGNLAEVMGKYLTKGSRVWLSGKLKTRKWQDQNGQDRYTTEIIASEMQMLDTKRSEDQHDSSQHIPGHQSSEAAREFYAPQPDPTQSPQGADVWDDDIPF